MPTAVFIFVSALIVLGAESSYLQDRQDVSTAHPADNRWDHALFDRVIENQKRNDAAMDIYERIERVESHKVNGERHFTETKITRVVPSGIGVGRIPLGLDGKPSDEALYRAELEKLEKSLVWAGESGHVQHEAYERIAKKKRDRDELIGAAKTAFLFTFIASEPRGGRTLLKYRMDPNPAFKPTSRSTSIYPRVRGVVWIDEESGQLARIEGEVMEDISLGIFLAKVYKGSHFMQERYEMAPGLWLPTFSQYDFDGRKFLASFSMHDRTFFSNYRLIGPPKEALALIRSELQRVRTPATASP
jgi:hypothetical protein